jgi:hypothetical protein
MFEQAAFLMALNKAFVDGVLAPFKKLYPNLDTWWATYLAWVTGIGLGLIANVQILGDYIPDPQWNLYLSSFLIGAGSTIFHSLFDNTVGVFRAYKNKLNGVG